MAREGRLRLRVKKLLRLDIGSKGQRNWTVTFSSNSKERFYSPIKQDRAHARALSVIFDSTRALLEPRRSP